MKNNYSRMTFRQVIVQSSIRGFLHYFALAKALSRWFNRRS